MELILVIFITTLLLALVYPSLSVLDNSASSEAKRLASIIRYLNDSSINRKIVYEMEINLVGKEVSYDSPDGKKTLILKSLQKIYLSSKGEVTEGAIKMPFGYEGLIEIFQASFIQEGKSITLTYNPYSRQVKMDTAQ